MSADNARSADLILQRYYAANGTSPLGDLFRSRGFVGSLQLLAGDNEHRRSLGDLPPFLRTLLVTDGTVTKALEAYYWEPVQVTDVAVQAATTRAAIPWLGLDAGADVLVRSVQLRGQRSGRAYAWAVSAIHSDRLPAGLRAPLLSGAIGIGELIRECGLETYRELLEFGTADTAAAFGGPVSPLECVHRSYRIIADRQPAILVSECFPLATFTETGPVQTSTHPA